MRYHVILQFRKDIKEILDVIIHKQRSGVSHFGKGDFLQPGHISGEKKRCIAEMLTDPELEDAATIKDYRNDRGDLN